MAEGLLGEKLLPKQVLNKIYNLYLEDIKELKDPNERAQEEEFWLKKVPNMPENQKYAVIQFRAWRAHPEKFRRVFQIIQKVQDYLREGKEESGLNKIIDEWIKTYQREKTLFK